MLILETEIQKSSVFKVGKDKRQSLRKYNEEIQLENKLIGTH